MFKCKLVEDKIGGYLEDLYRREWQERIDRVNRQCPKMLSMRVSDIIPFPNLEGHVHVLIKGDSRDTYSVVGYPWADGMELTFDKESRRFNLNIFL